MKTTVALIILQQCILICAAKKVVFFPFFQSSHIMSSIKVAEALTEHGHEAWVCVPQFSYNKGILTAAKVTLLAYGHEHNDIETAFFEETGMLSSFWHGSVSFFEMLSRMQTFMRNTSYNIFTDPSLISALENIKPDYFVLDSMPLLTNSLALPYKFQVPFTLMGVAYDIIGAHVPFSPAAVPSMLFQESFTSETTFTQRLKKTLAYFLMLVSDPIWDPRVAEVLVPGRTPPVSSKALTIKADLHLIENDVILGYAYPQLSNTVMIGGTSAVPAKQLPAKFEQVVENSPDGIALVSFGSSVSNIPPEIASKIVAAFQQLPFNTIWRINLTSPDEKKITTSTWIPQNDLLGHNNGTTTRVFVSHCGAWGQYEALYHGVPMLCLPIFSEQFFNGHRIHDKGFGTYADIRTISAEELASLIREVAFNETYRQTIREASALFKELYKNPTQTAAYWIDHVMRHGGKHLRAAGQDMPVYQLLLVDVLAFVAAVAFILASVIFLLVRCCCLKCCASSRIARKVKKN